MFVADNSEFFPLLTLLTVIRFNVLVGKVLFSSQRWCSGWMTGNTQWSLCPQLDHILCSFVMNGFVRAPLVLFYIRAFEEDTEIF